MRNIFLFTNKSLWRKGFTLLEAVVSLVILASLIALIGTLSLFIYKNEGRISYKYIALNLAREILEFGEGTEYFYEKSVTTCWPNRPPCGGSLPLSTPCGQCCCTKLCEEAYSYRMVYEYKPSQGKYLYDPSTDFTWLGKVVYDSSCRPFAGSDYYDYTTDTNLTINPFQPIGDIKSKNMVPQNYPDSVKIVYEVDGNTSPFSKEFRKHTVTVSWKSKDGENIEISLATVPLNRVNDTFKLKISKFWWQSQ